MPRILLPGSLLILLSLSASASAWNGFGHRAVARIACLEMTDGQQKAIFELLKHHPHFGTEFDLFSQERPAGASDVEWAILQSGTWPDYVRTPKFTSLKAEQIKVHPRYKYHRKFDHYFDIAIVHSNFKGKPKLDNPGTMLDALANAEKLLKDKGAALPDKAIAFCWLVHLVGDIHQPLHCSAFFSKEFPKGDAGGNLFLIGNTNLHSYWDGALGSESASFHHLEALSSDIHRAAHLQRSKLLELKQNLSYESWAKESNAIAATVAYKDGKKFLKGANKEHQNDDGEFSIPAFPPTYKDDAKVIARRRVALAGYRLADKIAGIFAN